MSIKIPATVETIGDSAFDFCTALTTVEFAQGSVLKTIGVGAFVDCFLQSIEIPASVETIGDSAFSGCMNLQEITFAGGTILQTIGDRAFAYCTEVKQIIIPETVKNMGEAVFYDWGEPQRICVPFAQNEIPAGWSPDWLAAASEFIVEYGYTGA